MVWMFYFILGGLPLLILKYDHPSDARLIRGFFDVHYIVSMCIAVVGTLANVLSDRPVLAAAIACVGLTGFTARSMIVSRLDGLRSTIDATNAPAMRRFRRLHLTGMAINVLLIAGMIWALAASSASVVSCYQVPAGCQGDECRTLCSLL